MTEIQTPNLYASYAQGVGFGQQIRDRNDKLRDQKRLQQLTSGVMSGDPSAITEATSIDPKVAGEYQDSGDRMLKRSGNMASMMLAAYASKDPARIQGTYQTMLPELTRLGAAQGVVPPPQFDESMLPHLYQIQAQASGITEKNATHVSKQFTNAAGDVMVMMSDGTVSATGQKALPNSVLYDAGDNGAFMVDKRTNQAAPINIGGGQPQATPPAPTPPTQQTGTATDGSPINTYQTTAADGSQVRIDPSIPANERAAILANPSAAATDGATVNAPAQVLPAPGAAGVAPGQQLRHSPKPVAPSALQERIAQAKQMGASDAEIKAMVVGNSAVDSTAPGAEGFSDDAKQLAATAMAHGYAIPMPSMGYGKAGAAAKAAAMNQLAAQIKAGGMSWDQGISNMIQGKTATQGLTGLQKTFANVSGWEASAASQATIALELSNKVNRTGVPVFNAWLMAGRKATGDVDVAQFDNATNTLAEEYAKVMGGGGNTAATDSSRALAHKMLSSAMSQDQFTGVVSLLQREMKARTDALHSAVETQRGSIVGGNAAPEAQANGSTMSKDEALQHLHDAREAVKAGADKEAVRKRLIEMGLPHIAGVL